MIRWLRCRLGRHGTTSIAFDGKGWYVECDYCGREVVRLVRYDQV